MFVYPAWKPWNQFNLEDRGTIGMEEVTEKGADTETVAYLKKNQGN